jgi:hypothetical protein
MDILPKSHILAFAAADFYEASKHVEVWREWLSSVVLLCARRDWCRVHWWSRAASNGGVRAHFEDQSVCVGVHHVHAVRAASAGEWSKADWLPRRCTRSLCACLCAMSWSEERADASSSWLFVADLVTVRTTGYQHGAADFQARPYVRALFPGAVHRVRYSAYPTARRRPPLVVCTSPCSVEVDWKNARARLCDCCAGGAAGIVPSQLKWSCMQIVCQ